MGLFDTIHLKTPLICPACGADSTELQTKEFGQTMSEFRVGSLLKFSPVLTGIVREELFCRNCVEADRRSDSPVYLIIWNSILAGVEQDRSTAEARLASVDRLDLIGWLDESQREAAQWKHRYSRLYRDVKMWHEHLTREPEPEPADETSRRRRSLRSLWSLPEEILNAPDPLATILEKNELKQDDPQDEGLFGLR